MSDDRVLSFDVIETQRGNDPLSQVSAGFSYPNNGAPTGGDLMDMTAFVQQVHVLNEDNKQLQTKLKENNTQLRERVEELNEIKIQQEEALQRLTAQSENTKAKIQAMTNRQKELEMQLEVEKAEKERLARQLGGGSSREDKEKIHQLEEQIKEFKKQRDDHLHKESRLTDSVEKYIEENRKLQGELQEIRDQYEELEMVNQEMDTHVRSLLREQKEGLKRQQQQQMLGENSALQLNSDLMSQVRVFTAENQHLRQQLEQSANVIEDLQQKLVQTESPRKQLLRQEIAQADHVIKELQRQLDQKIREGSEIQNLEQEAAQSAHLVEELQQQLNQKVREISEHQQEYQRLKQEMAESAKRIEELEQQLEQKTMDCSEIENLREEVTQSAYTIQELEQQMQQKTIETSVQLRRKHLATTELNSEASSGVDSETSLHQKLDNLNSENEQLRGENEQLEKEKLHLKSEVDRLQQVSDAQQDSQGVNLWKQRHEQATKAAEQLKIEHQLQERVSRQQIAQAEKEKKEVERDLEKMRTQFQDLMEHMNMVSGGSSEKVAERVKELESENEYLQFQVRLKQLNIHEDGGESGNQMVKMKKEVLELSHQLEKKKNELEQAQRQEAQLIQLNMEEKEELKKRISDLEESLNEARALLKESAANNKESLEEQLAAQEYELKQQFQEKFQVLQAELTDAKDRSLQTAQKVAEERLEAMREDNEKHRQMVNKLEQQLKMKTPIPIPAPRVRQGPDMKQLQEMNEKLSKDNIELNQQVDRLDKRVVKELEQRTLLATERDQVAAKNCALEQALQEQTSQVKENQSVKQQFVALIEHNRHLQDGLDEALRGYDLESEKCEELNHRLLALEQQVRIERQRSSADTSGLQQRIQMLEADYRQQHEHSQQQQYVCFRHTHNEQKFLSNLCFLFSRRSFQEAYDKVKGERDMAQYDYQLLLKKVEDMSSQYQECLQRKEQLMQECKHARENLDQVTARYMSAEELIEEKESDMKEMEVKIRQLEETASTVPILQQQSEVWKTDFEAEREARQKTSEDREALLHDLDQLRRGAQDAAFLRDDNRRLKDELDTLRKERLHELQRRRADTQGHQPLGSSYQGGSFSNPSGTSAGTPGGYDQQPHVMQSQPTCGQVTCPKCSLQFPDMDTFEIHANDCIE
jgi:chromosome segregation ATPase